MKVDTETLLKHKFWVLAALCVPLTLFALVLLATSVAGTISAKQKEIEKNVKALKGFADPKRPDEVNLKKREAELNEGLKDLVWEGAWQAQAELSTWPEKIESEFHFKDGLFALKVQAERTKTSAAEQGAGELPKNQFRGEITHIENAFMNVQGKEGKEGKGKRVVKRFQRTPNMEIKLSDDKNKDQTVPFERLLQGDQVTITYQVGKFFGDPLTEAEQKVYQDSYNSQLLDILKVVDPVTAAGKGVVQLRDWPFGEDVDQLPPSATFLNFVPSWKQNRYLSKEAWTAQEDLWIQRELYRLVKQANNFVARFHGPGGAGKDKEFVFTNAYWELRLRLTADDKLALQIKNQLSRRQKADVSFLVRVRPDGEPVKIFVGGMLPLNPGEARKVPAMALRAGLIPTGVYSVEQVLTPQTAAVRRIDFIALGSGTHAGGAATALGGPKTGAINPFGGMGLTAAGGKGSRAESHRLFPKELVAFAFPGDPKEEEAPKEVASAPKTAMPGLPGGQGSGPMMPTPGAVGGQGSKISPNGLVFERYLEVTPQARRVPVGIVLIVDQQHVGLVQAAFADSVLRFLTNQVILNRYPHNLRSPETTTVVAAPKGPPDLTRAFAPGGIFPGGSLPMMPRMPGGSSFPGAGGSGFPPSGVMPGAGSTPGTRTGTAAEEPESNVELVLYGVVSLYERYRGAGASN